MIERETRKGGAAAKLVRVLPIFNIDARVVYESFKPTLPDVMYIIKDGGLGLRSIFYAAAALLPSYLPTRILPCLSHLPLECHLRADEA